MIASAVERLGLAVLHRFPAETAHRVALSALERGLVPPQPMLDDLRMRVPLFGRLLPHPIGMAGGFDKNARVYRNLYAQGFSFVEVGGVTPLPQRGNPRPRMFRLAPDRAIINRAGFPNDGAARVAGRLRGRERHRMLGVNLAANTATNDAVADLVSLVATFAPHAEFLTLDLSCPNTANGREFLQVDRLEALLERVDAVRARLPHPRPAFAAKVGPDLTEADLTGVLGALREFGIDAIIATNTSDARPASLRDPKKRERGGLSGPPIRTSSTAVLRAIFTQTAGSIPLIGVGGIASGEDAYAKIRAGATVVQLYTALVYSGMHVVSEIYRELLASMERDGFASITDAVGADQRSVILP